MYSFPQITSSVMGHNVKIFIWGVKNKFAQVMPSMIISHLLGFSINMQYPWLDEALTYQIRAKTYWVLSCQSWTPDSPTSHTQCTALDLPASPQTDRYRYSPYRGQGCHSCMLYALCRSPWPCLHCWLSGGKSVREIWEGILSTKQI